MSEIETAEAFAAERCRDDCCQTCRADGRLTLDPKCCVRLRDAITARDAATTRRALLDAAEDCERQAELARDAVTPALRAQAKRIRMMAEGKGER